MVHLTSTHDVCGPLMCGCRRATLDIFTLELDPCPTCRHPTTKLHIIECVGCGAVWVGKQGGEA